MNNDTIMKNKTKVEDSRMPMGRRNYMFMAAGFAMIVVGFLLMLGGGSADPEVFDADRLFSFRRITLAPIVILAGFGLEIYAIMMRPKEERASESKK